MRRRSLGAGAVACIATLVLLSTSIASAAKPERAPFDPLPTSLVPGEGCGFDVTISTAPGSNYTETLFSEVPLHLQITGSGHDTVTNTSASPPKSVTLPTSGKLTIQELPTGDQRIRASGRTVIYLYAGDEGPNGTVDEPGALYYFVGQVDEILSTENIITSFEYSGRAIELCSLIDE